MRRPGRFLGNRELFDTRSIWMVRPELRQNTLPENYIRKCQSPGSNKIATGWGAVAMGGRIMVNIIAIGRIGILGVGLGIGAALAAMPGIAAADPSPDPNIYGAVDASVLQDAFPAADPSTLNIDISVDGITLFQEGTASATSGSGDIAIAVGNDASATATGGVGDFASASGTDSVAFAGDGNFDLATASSVFSTTGGIATAGKGNFDVAQAGGLNGVATANNGSFDSAYALTGNSGSAVVEFGSGDSATNIGDGSASAGGTSDSLMGNFDFATNLGSLSEATAGSSDIASGSYDIAAILAGGTGDATATGGNFLVEILPSLF
jgi:hypothetical protein